MESQPTHLTQVLPGSALRYSLANSPSNNLGLPQAASDLSQVMLEVGQNPFVIFACPWCGIVMGHHDYGTGTLLQDQVAATLNSKNISQVRRPKGFTIVVDKDLIQQNAGTFVAIAKLLAGTGSANEAVSQN